MTTLASLLHETAQRLTKAGVSDPRLEADLIWMTALDLDRTHLYAELRQEPPLTAQRQAQALLDRRLRREPVAYLMGRREFYGLSFFVAPGVLIPRPETELIVEEALRKAAFHPEGEGLLIADIGTGSGIIAVSVAVHLSEAVVYATDLSDRAFEVAKLNADAHAVGQRVQFLKGDLLSPLPQPVDLLLANLPYVMSAEIPLLEPEVSRYEPAEALDGGDDGLALIRRLLKEAPRYLQPHGSIVLEMDPRQIERASAYARSIFPNASITALRDYTRRERVLVVQTPQEDS